MKEGRVIHDSQRFALTVERLCQELIETYDDFRDTCLLGIQTGGVPLCDRVVERLRELGLPEIPYGKLDITFYRDDFRTRTEPLQANRTEIDFLVEGKKVILVDDVLYTGRTIQAALIALNHYGRPEWVELMVMVNRRFNRHLPIQPDYQGVIVDSLDETYVRVEWEEMDGQDQILLFPRKPVTAKMA